MGSSALANNTELPIVPMTANCSIRKVMLDSRRGGCQTSVLSFRQATAYAPPSYLNEISIFTR